MLRIGPLCIAHRGDTTNFPQNTLEAFISAFERGADGVELDVHLYEGKVIVVHDYLFDKHVPYPQLRDILSAISTRGRIEIEVKAFTADILPILRSEIELFPQADIELTTSEIPLCRYIHDFFPHTPIGIIFHDFLFEKWMTEEVILQKLTGWAGLAMTQRLHIPFQVIASFGGEELVRKLHTAGYIVHSHIVQSPEQEDVLQSLVNWKVDQCTFDDIGLLES